MNFANVDEHPVAARADDALPGLRDRRPTADWRSARHQPFGIVGIDVGERRGVTTKNASSNAR